jgi:hypothetical protein
MVKSRFDEIRIDGGRKPRPARDTAWNFNPDAGTGKMRILFFTSHSQDTPRHEHQIG